MSNHYSAIVSERIPDAAIPGGIGLLLGLVSSAFAYYQAQAAVKVRPNLATVGFIDAALTNHAGDWLFYHMPVVGTIIALAFWISAVTIMAEVFR